MGLVSSPTSQYIGKIFFGEFFAWRLLQSLHIEKTSLFFQYGRELKICRNFFLILALQPRTSLYEDLVYWYFLAMTRMPLGLIPP